MRHLALLVLAATACTPGFEENQNGQESCAGPLGKPISASSINAMTACCQAEQGKAHCLESSKVPGEIQPFVAECDAGGYCIPDSFLATGAAKPPQECEAFGGAGVCLSVCIPQVAENAGLLKQESCANADERCVPCISPLDQMPTGACDLLTLARCEGEDPGVGPDSGCDDPSTCNYEANCAPVIDPSTLPSCGADAHCVDAALAGDQAASLAKCDDGVKVCVPDPFIKTGGKFTPATCKSVNDAEGRCLNVVIPQVADQAALLPQDTCAESEKCTPCFNPLDGTPTGACSLSCDTGPTTTAQPLASCCDGRAKCVPATAIPDDQEDQLSEQECEDSSPGSLCVPNEIIANGPFPACSANSFILGNYTGVCLSDCLDFGFQGIALARGNCQSGFKCAPCEQNGQPTGAPGCPP
jgi:hypothetical protein